LKNDVETSIVPFSIISDNKTKRSKRAVGVRKRRWRNSELFPFGHHPVSAETQQSNDKHQSTHPTNDTANDQQFFIAQKCDAESNDKHTKANDERACSVRIHVCEVDLHSSIFFI
jgi:hypothetical protein